MSRISPGTLLVLIVAVMFGLLGAYVVRKNLQPEEEAVAQQRQQVQTIVVPRASMDLANGRKITLGDIVVRSMTSEQMKKAGVTKAFMSDTRQIIGRTIKTDMKAGDTFDSSVLYPEGMGPSVVDQLKPGMRAVTVAVELNAAVEGFAGAGTWVDLLFRAEHAIDEDHPETTVTLLEGVQVLALNRETFAGAAVDNADAKTTTVTVAVTPDQAAALRVADGRGTMSLALRHPEDEVVIGNTAPKTLDELLKRPNSKHKMQIYRGHQLTQVEFKQDDRLTPTENYISRDRDRDPEPEPEPVPVSNAIMKKSKHSPATTP